MRRWLSLGISLLLFSTFTNTLSSSCNIKSEACSSKTQNLNEILEKNFKKQQSIKIAKSNTMINQEDIIEKEEKVNIHKNESQTKNDKIENPLIFILVLIGFVVMYYYFNEKKYKRKK